MRLLLAFAFAFSLQVALSQTDYYTNLINRLATQHGLIGGNWITAAEEQQSVNAATAYGGTLAAVSATGQSFTKARQILIPSPQANPWNAGIFWENAQLITPGSRILVVMWLRSATPESGKANIFIENSTDFTKEAYLSVEITPQWREYLIPFEASSIYISGNLRVGLHVGQKAQTIQVGGVAIRDFAGVYPLSQFPLDLHQDYAGSAPDAPWRAEAADRIEQMRKANLQVLVQGNSGAPLNGATVTVEMLQHDFKFGSAITANRIAGNNAQDNVYQGKILDFDGEGHGFNEVVFENDLKWDGWEEHWSASEAEIVNAAQWLRQRNIAMRGHNLIWPGWGYLPDDLQPNALNLAYLRQRMDERIEEMLTYPGLTENISEWDVLNEITANNDLANAFKGSPGYPTGREIYVDILQKVKSVNPAMVSYLNDYVTIDLQNAPGSPVYEQCKQYILEAKNGGGPVDGIGFQAHIGAGLTSIYDAKAILDDFYNSTGCRSKITEFDYSNYVNDSLAARFTRDFLTLCFSHSSCDGFLSWGFWDGAHWLGNAPYFRQDWTLRPAGRAVADLLFRDWWTNAVENTDAAGQAQIRGFKGQYRVTVACNGQTIATDTIQLLDNLALTYTCSTSGSGWAIQDAATLQLNRVLAVGESLQLQASQDLAHLRLLAADGRCLGSQYASGTMAQWPLQVPAGVYFLHVRFASGAQRTERVVVR